MYLRYECPEEGLLLFVYRNLWGCQKIIVAHTVCANLPLTNAIYRLILVNRFIINLQPGILLHNLFKVSYLPIFVSTLHALSLISPHLAIICFLHFHCFTVALIY